MDSCSAIHPSGFERYWRHYYFMKSWIRKHRQVVGEISESNRCHCQHAEAASPSHQTVFKIPAVPPARWPPMSQDTRFEVDSSSAVSSPDVTPRPKAKKRKNKRKRKPSSTASVTSHGADSEHFEAELNEEFIEFMQRSALHKQQREVVKRKENFERMEVDARGVLVDEKARMAAPTEQPGMRRTHEIRLLYGDRSLKIHGMETAQQLCFQQACDKMKPQHWPNIPLRISFT